MHESQWRFGFLMTCTNCVVARCQLHNFLAQAKFNKRGPWIIKGKHLESQNRVRHFFTPNDNLRELMWRFKDSRVEAKTERSNFNPNPDF